MMTKEERQEYKKEYHEANKDKAKAYYQRPEVKERGKNKALISQSRNDYLISLPPEKLLEIVRLKDVDEE